MARLSDRIVIDDDREIFTFDGAHFDADVFAAFIAPTRPGLWFRIVGRSESGALLIETKTEGVDK